MPSTYTLNNGIELIATGEQSGTWGDTTKTNFELLDTALDGQVSVTLAATGSSGSPNTLPISDGASSNGRNRLVIFGDGGDLGGTAFVQLTPNDAEKIIYVRNNLSGSRSILLFQGTYNASNDYEVPAGTTAVVFFDGAGSGAVAANVFNNAFFDSLRLGSVSVDKILDEDNMASNDAAALATQQSIKAYVDSQVTAQDLDFGGDSGTGAVDLDSQTFTIAGTANEIETSASGQTLTVGLPDNVTIAGDLTVDTDTLYVDSANDRVGINTASPTVALDVSSTAIHSQFRVHRDVAGDNTTMGTILFAGDDSDGNVTDYSRIVGLAESDNSGGEDGQLIFSVLRNASMTEAMRIHSNQRILIGGQSDTLTVGGIAALLQVENTSGSAAISIARHTASVNSGYLNFGKSRGADATIVQENDATGYIQWAGADGTDINSYTAYISSAVDGTPGSNDMPGRLMFWTTADGSSSPTERMRIDNAGRVGIGGIDPSTFSGSANQLVISGSSNTGLTIDATSTTESNIFFADGADGTEAYRGIIRYHHSDDSFRFFTNGGSEAMRIDSSQRVLVGAGTARTDFFNTSATASLQVEGTTANTAAASIVRNSNDDNGPQFILGKSNGTSVGSDTIVTDDALLGRITYQGADGAELVEGARIEGKVDGVPGSNDMPGKIVFSTTLDGSSSPSNRMTIANNGNIAIGTAADPSVRLDLKYSEATNYGIKVTNTNTTITAKSGITMPVSNGTGGGAIYVDSAVLGGNGNTYDMHLETFQGASSIVFEPTGTEAMRIDSSQRVLIGHTSSPTNIWGGQQNYLQVIGTSWDGSGLGLHNYNNSTTAANISFSKSRGSIGTGGTIVQDGDYLGFMNFSGDDGTDLNSGGAQIFVQVDGTPGVDDMPGRIVFRTTADGATSPTERMRITSTGLISVGRTLNYGTASGSVVQAGNNNAVVNAIQMAYADANAGSGNTATASVELANTLGISAKLRFHAEVDCWFYINAGSDKGAAKFIFAGYFNGGSSSVQRYDVFNTDTENIGTASVYTDGANKGIQVTFTNSDNTYALYGQIKVNVTWNP